MHRRRTENFVVADADRDVPIVGRGESLVVDAPTNFTDLLLLLVNVNHSSNCHSGLKEMFFGCSLESLECQVFGYFDRQFVKNAGVVCVDRASRRDRTAERPPLLR